MIHGAAAPIVIPLLNEIESTICSAVGTSDTANPSATTATGTARDSTAIALIISNGDKSGGVDKYAADRGHLFLQILLTKLRKMVT